MVLWMALLAENSLSYQGLSSSEVVGFVVKKAQCWLLGTMVPRKR